MSDSLRSHVSKIYSVDQSCENFNLENWLLKTKAKGAFNFCLTNEEITAFEREYKKELKDVYEEALKDIEKYGQWLGYKG